MTTEPRLLGLLCSWCSYRAADNAGASHLSVPASLHVIGVACTGRVDPAWVLRAFASGIDGVLVAGCHPGDCHYVDGNLKARGRMSLLGGVLRQWGFETGRLQVAWIGAGEADRFASVAREFNDRIRALGPVRPEQTSAVCR